MLKKQLNREEIVKELADEALHAMDGCGIEGITPAEVLSACFTMTKNVISVVLQEGEASSKAHNEEIIRTAIANLYQLVLPETLH